MLSPEIIKAVDKMDWIFKDEKTNQQRYKVIESLLNNEKCTARALIRDFIDGCGKIEIGSEADKALTPIRELAKMYVSYNIEELRAIEQKPISQQLKEIWEVKTCKITNKPCEYVCVMIDCFLSNSEPNDKRSVATKV